MKKLIALAGAVLLSGSLMPSSLAAEPQNQATILRIEELLKNGPNFNILAQDAERKSEILTTASEQEIRQDVQNAVQKMELRYTLNLKVILSILGEDGKEKERFQIGKYTFFYTLHAKQGDKLPLDTGISFVFPEKNAVTTLAQAKVLEPDLDKLFSEKFQQDLGGQLSAKISEEIKTLSGPNADDFKKAFAEFIQVFTKKVIPPTRESLGRTIKQYPAAEAGILKQAQDKYGSAASPAAA